MKSLKFRLQYYALLLLTLLIRLSVFAQITPSQDSYINTATAATNYGSAPTLGVVSSGSSIQTTYIKFDLSPIPASYKSSNVAKATLKLFVNSVSTNGSFNLDLVNGTWSEKTITANLLPALGTTVKGSIPLTTANVNNYITIDLTTAVGEWLNGTQANDGIALVPNSPLSATFQSKENTSQSHPAELDIVFANGATISGITTASGGGLSGGGTTGTLNLSLLKTCAANQVLQWNGSAWVCATVSAGGGTGTITGVKAGTDLTGGGTTGAVTLNLDTTKVPQLNAANSFVGTQTVNGDLSATGTLVGGSAYVSNPTPAATSIYGLASATTGQGWGVGGVTASTDQHAYGVVGENFATSGSGAGVYGAALSAAASGVFGTGGTGVEGQGTYAGGAGGSFLGYMAANSSGLAGTPGVLATGGSTDPSLYADAGAAGIEATGGKGFNGGSGVLGFGATAQSGGLDGVGGYFVGGQSKVPTTGDGIDAVAGSGVAGSFKGDVYITGNISAATKSFRIDHPIDPANKYLVHASVESSELMNIYTGNVITDAIGEATVTLPEWFEALNTDFRYQLTVVGQFAQAVVGHKIENHQFQIKTSVPNVEVSWQVTGVRQDAYAKAHPLVVEEEKEDKLKGFYIHPELYGARDEKQIEWARHPAMMKHIQQQQTKTAQQAKTLRAKTASLPVASSKKP